MLRGYAGIRNRPELPAPLRFSGRVSLGETVCYLEFHRVYQIILLI